ncbi:hypothetical protein [Kordiimonas sp. SCSIO 12610]|uniref:hypothetical protein n=1 Tax=Kordiimonas sp. SCSIO 12610 TaxID=2829597 RepID=UPI002109B2B9|nr:hypothetical protein [Kordiimonas sp. SCSIO 12610]UTW56752.1 hypothetical protein KFF44_07650 [Kordiimonas sp. SCSIO 12610]
MFKLVSSIVIFAGVLGCSTSANAQATPSDVLVSVETAQNELRLLYDADMQEVPSAKVTSSAPRRPRHVYFKAREVYQKVKALKEMNGLTMADLPEVPKREIRPTEVKELVDNIRKNLGDIKAKYFVVSEATTAAKKNGKGPTDVYLGLTYTSQLIDGLDMPNVVPNDVYRVALAVLEEARVISRAQNGSRSEAELELVATGKKPVDVYNNGETLLNLISDMSQNKEGYEIPAGVVLPNRPSGNITPGHVMDLMSNTLAELSALKAKLGIAESAANQPAQAGKTPSNVFDVIETTKAVLSGI